MSVSLLIKNQEKLDQPIALRSEQLFELLNRQAGLSNNTAQRAGFEIVCSVKRNCHDPPRILRVHEKMVAPGHSIGDEASLAQGGKNLPGVGDRKARIHAATEIFRSCGGMSPGIASPCSLR